MGNESGSFTGELILASGSAARKQMLQAAGVVFRVVPADIDEAAIRKTLTANDAEIEPGDVAEVLARAKAEAVSTDHPGVLVVGADQVLSLGDRIFEKPADCDVARDQLLALRGRTHRLYSAVVLALDGETVWSTGDMADMTMRPFSPEFLGAYLAAGGDAICQSVGAYQLEGLGAQLFEKIEGDYFTILGMPLLGLLNELRGRGALRT